MQYMLLALGKESSVDHCWPNFVHMLCIVYVTIKALVHLICIQWQDIWCTFYSEPGVVRFGLMFRYEYEAWLQLCIMPSSGERSKRPMPALYCKLLSTSTHLFCNMQMSNPLKITPGALNQRQCYMYGHPVFKVKWKT